MRVIAFSASPRVHGNSEHLLDRVVEGIESVGAEVEKIRTHELVLSPCNGCGGCDRSGKCVVEDEFQRIYKLLIGCDGVVFASPLYFMNVPARGKALIDRCQCFWVARRILGMDLFNRRKRFGMLVACSGAEFGPGGSDVFRGIQDTMTYFFDALALEKQESVLVRGVDSPGAVLNRSEELRKAGERGRDIARHF